MIEKCSLFFFAFLKQIKHISFYDIVVFVTLLTDVLFINGPNEVVIITLFVLIFIKTALFKKWDYKEFALAVFFLLICPIFLALHNKPAALRAGIWIYVLLMIGTIKALITLSKEKI